MERSASVMTQTRSLSYRVGAEDPVALAQGDLVLAAVEGAQLSPVARGVASQQVEGVLPRLREQLQGPRSGHDPPEGERRPHRPLLALKAILGAFEAMFGPLTSTPSLRDRPHWGTLAASSSSGPIRPHLLRASSENHRGP